MIGERPVEPRLAEAAAVLFRFSLALGARSVGGGVFKESTFSEAPGLPKNNSSEDIQECSIVRPISSLASKPRVSCTIREAYLGVYCFLLEQEIEVWTQPGEF